MRVIAGTARGRPLTGPAGSATRPTSDKVKGALFSMIESLLATARPRPTIPQEELVPGGEEIWEGLTVLDLYAGTGALGIEALSRGAAWCDFVESNAAARRIIERNLKVTGLDNRARVISLSVEKVVEGAAGSSLHAPYGVVLADPPYADLSVADVVATVAREQLLENQGLVAVEHSRRVALPAWYSNDNSMPGGLREVRERHHGDTVLSIYRRVSEKREGDDNADDGDLPGEL
ncbi:MAG TPA: RsmD family RNA methyltransferase [Chloroflexota bacterium]|nr:RsmD family RNA methyltransferase [Chloroflexota bacterium]